MSLHKFQEIVWDIAMENIYFETQIMNIGQRSEAKH